MTLSPANTSSVADGRVSTEELGVDEGKSDVRENVGSDAADETLEDGDDVSEATFGAELDTS